MKRGISVLIFLGVLLFGLNAAVADTIIYDNGISNPADMDLASTSDFDPYDFLGQTYTDQQGDDFVLTSSSTITDIHWWGRYEGDFFTSDFIAPDDFTIRIFHITAAVPDPNFFIELTDLDVQRTPTGDTFIPYAYSVDIEPITLMLDTPFLLSIVNNTAGDPDWWQWGAKVTNPDGNGVHRSADLDPWIKGSLTGIVTDYELAFQLTTVPEPSTLLLVGMGIAGVGLLRRRFKK